MHWIDFADSLDFFNCNIRANYHNWKDIANKIADRESTDGETVQMTLRSYVENIDWDDSED